LKEEAEKLAAEEAARIKAEQERAAAEEAKVSFDTQRNTQATSISDTTNLKTNMHCIAHSEVEGGGWETGSWRSATSQGWRGTRNWRSKGKFRTQYFYNIGLRHNNLKTNMHCIARSEAEGGGWETGSWRSGTSQGSRGTRSWRSKGKFWYEHNTSMASVWDTTISKPTYIPLRAQRLKEETEKLAAEEAARIKAEQERAVAEEAKVSFDSQRNTQATSISDTTISKSTIALCIQRLKEEAEKLAAEEAARIKAEQERAAAEDAKVSFDTQPNTQAMSISDTANLKTNIHSIARLEVEGGGRETGSWRSGTSQGWKGTRSGRSKGKFWYALKYFCGIGLSHNNLKTNIHSIARLEVEGGGRETGSWRRGTSQGWKGTRSGRSKGTFW